MAELLHLDLVTPDKRYASSEVELVVVPGELGDFGVMANHAPIISMIRPGLVEIHDDKGDVTRYFINGGYANVASNNCTILAESLIPYEELQRGESEEALAALKDELASAESEVTRAAIERRIIEEETKLILAG